MSAHWARPGVECRCISAGWIRGRSLSLWRWLYLVYVGLPVVGGIYWVTHAGRGSNGIVYIQIKGWSGIWFAAENFRPLTRSRQERDLALFTPLLDPAAPPIPADARSPEVVS